MGSPCAIHVEAAGAPTENPHELLEHCLAACVTEAQRFESRYTRFREDSVIGRINAAAGDWVAVDEEMERLLDYAEACWQASDGTFDVTSGPLRAVWHRDMEALPDKAALTSVLTNVGWRKVQRRPGAVRLPHAGMALDFGGIVKEYAADAVAGLAQRLGIRHGIVDLGGDLKIIGPHLDGSGWDIGITDPWRAGAALAHIQLVQGAVATSGDYERGFNVAGRRYSHLLDPRSGWPVEGLVSVSVAAETAVVAGSLSSIAMLMAESEALTWLDSLALPYVAVSRRRNVHTGGASRKEGQQLRVVERE